MVNHEEFNTRRVKKIIEALTNGVHWMQVLRQETGEKKGNLKLFSTDGYPISAICDLAALTEKLLSEESRPAVVAWACGDRSNCDVGQRIARLRGAARPRSERLPAALLESALRPQVTRFDTLSAAAIANLAQLLFIEQIRGVLTDSHVRLYQALGLKLNFRQLGLPNTDTDFLALAKQLAPRTAPAPYATDEYAWRFVLRLVENWGDKQTGIRDKTVLARELLRGAEIAPLLPTLRTVPRRRVAFLGHSLMINRHWSSLGAWSTIASELMREINAGFEYADFQSGDLTMPRAVNEHLDTLIAYKPTETYILTLPPSSAAEQEASVKVLSALREIGCRIYVIDDLRPDIVKPERYTPETRNFIEQICRDYQAHLLPWQELARRAPGHEHWMAIDNIHMDTAGHLYFAKELLKRWANEKAVP